MDGWNIECSKNDRNKRSTYDRNQYSVDGQNNRNMSRNVQSILTRFMLTVCMIIALTGCSQQHGQDARQESLKDSSSLATRQQTPSPTVQRQVSPDGQVGTNRGERNSAVPKSVSSALPEPITLQSLESKVSLSTQPKSVRGIYLSSFAATTPSKLRSIQSLIDKTELNAVVLDINSGTHLVALPSGASSVFAPARSRGAQQLRAAVRQLKQRNIYMIARIVTFKDSALVAAKPEWAIRRKSGSVWQDRKGHAWIDPYKEEAWPYYKALTTEAAKAGFDEVQFDYVRFPENGSKVDREVRYAKSNNETKSKVIGRFLKQATESAHQQGLRVSADIFGMVGSTADDMGIGQRWKDLAPATDVLSPMIYPSHYANGIWGIRHPDLVPKSIIAKALKDAGDQNKAIKASGVRPAEVRPWLQGFTASWIHPHQKYGPAQIQAQIQAARNAGFSSYLIWNSACRYPVF